MSVAKYCFWGKPWIKTDTILTFWMEISIYHKLNLKQVIKNDPYLATVECRHSICYQLLSLSHWVMCRHFTSKKYWTSYREQINLSALAHIKKLKIYFNKYKSIYIEQLWFLDIENNIWIMDSYDLFWFSCLDRTAN